MEGRREITVIPCGLDSVTLVDVLVFHCKCGAITQKFQAWRRFPNNPIHLLRRAVCSLGTRSKFLRKMAGYKATKLASIMGIGNEAVSMGNRARKRLARGDRLVRFACLDGILRLKAPQFAKASERMLEHAKMVASFQLPDFLAHIDEEWNGPKAVRMAPRDLALFGDGSLPVDSSPPLGPLSTSGLLAPPLLGGLAGDLLALLRRQAVRPRLPSLERGGSGSS